MEQHAWGAEGILLVGFSSHGLEAAPSLTVVDDAILILAKQHQGGTHCVLLCNHLYEPGHSALLGLCKLQADRSKVYYFAVLQAHRCMFVLFLFNVFGGKKQSP